MHADDSTAATRQQVRERRERAWQTFLAQHPYLRGHGTEALAWHRIAFEAGFQAAHDPDGGLRAESTARSAPPGGSP